MLRDASASNLSVFGGVKTNPVVKISLREALLRPEDYDAFVAAVNLAFDTAAHARTVLTFYFFL